MTASGGVATFSGLTLNKAASGYTIVITSSGLGEGVTNAMTVTPATAAQLVITQPPPSTVNVNTRFSMQASIEDAYGNVVTTASNSVSVAFANNPTGATLGGTRTVTVSSGVASFTNLTINKTGSGYTLQVSSSGLTSATSNSINVTKSGYTASTLSVPTGNTVTGLSTARRSYSTARISGTASDSRALSPGLNRSHRVTTVLVHCAVPGSRKDGYCIAKGRQIRTGDTIRWKESHGS